MAKLIWNGNPWITVMLCVFAFLAAVVDSIGGGGGLISLPAYLLTGLPASAASGSNKFSACFGTMVSAIRYGKGKKLLMKPALAGALGAFPMSFVGAWLLQHVPDGVARGILLVGVPVMAAVLLLKKDAEPKPKPLTKKRLALCFVIGAGIGFYDGFFGPGTGTLLIMLFTWLIGMDMVTASGSAKIVNLSSNLAALISYIIGGNVVYLLAIPAMVFSMAGNFVGSQLAMKKGAKLIRTVMFCVLGLIMVKLIYEWLA